MWLDERMFIFERAVGSRSRYRIAAESVWDPVNRRPFGRQVVLGSAERPPKVDLSKTEVVGTRHVGDAGALVWAAEQLEAVRLIDEACGMSGSPKAPSIGEMAVAVALQRTCAPSAKCELPSVLERFLPRHCCLGPQAFSGQAFYRLAAGVTDEMLEKAQLALARTAIEKFEISADALCFDTTNFDTFIATPTRNELARRGHAKSKRRNLRVVGLAVLVSETGHVPLLYRTYPGNGSDQTVLTDCLGALKELHQALADAEGRPRAQRTLVRDGGSWSEQLELELNVAGYYTLISLPLGHNASKVALEFAAQRGQMKGLRGSLSNVRAARLVSAVGDLKRTLVVVESEELLRGQKRGIAVALRKAKSELRKVAKRLLKNGEKKSLSREGVELRVARALAREHLSDFVVVKIGGSDNCPTLAWNVDMAKRRELERTRLGRRVLCTDQHNWSTERIVSGFRGQWNVEEVFRRAKKGGIAPWGPSFQRVDPCLRLHTFATVLGLTLVSLAKLKLGFRGSAKAMMRELAEIRATLVRQETGKPGRRPTYLIPPKMTSTQRRAVEAFQLERWMPELLSSRT